MRTKNSVRVFLVAAVLLLVPLLAMRFTGEVVWNTADFLVAGALLVSCGLGLELIAAKAGSVRYRVVGSCLLAAVFLAMWAQLAVGVLGS